MLSSDQNTLAGTHSQHSTSQDDVAGVEEANPGFPAVQLADAQVGGGLHPVPCAWSPVGKGSLGKVHGLITVQIQHLWVFGGDTAVCLTQ